MDRPEIIRVLFHPVQVPRNAAPQDAVDIDIPVTGNAVIGCRFFSRAKDAPVLLFFHGNSETLTDYDDIGPLYLQEGLNFLVTGYRGYGWSTGSPLTSTLLSDAEDMFIHLGNWLRREGYTGGILVMGRSLGSVCAIDLAVRHPEEIAGLVLESAFAETLPLARLLGVNLEHLGISEEQTFNNLGKIRQWTKPTFILHGQLDHLIPLSQAEKLNAACGAHSKELQIIPGAGHNTMIAVGGSRYFQAIRGFADKVTGKALDWREKRRRFKAVQAERKV